MAGHQQVDIASPGVLRYGTDHDAARINKRHAFVDGIGCFCAGCAASRLGPRPQPFKILVELYKLRGQIV